MNGSDFLNSMISPNEQIKKVQTTLMRISSRIKDCYEWKWSDVKTIIDLNADYEGLFQAIEFLVNNTNPGFSNQLFENFCVDKKMKNLLFRKMHENGLTNTEFERILSEIKMSGELRNKFQNLVTFYKKGMTFSDEKQSEAIVSMLFETIKIHDTIQNKFISEIAENKEVCNFISIYMKAYDERFIYGNNPLFKDYVDDALTYFVSANEIAKKFKDTTAQKDMLLSNKQKLNDFVNTWGNYINYDKQPKGLWGFIKKIFYGLVYWWYKNTIHKKAEDISKILIKKNAKDKEIEKNLKNDEKHNNLKNILVELAPKVTELGTEIEKSKTELEEYNSKFKHNIIKIIKLRAFNFDPQKSAESLGLEIGEKELIVKQLYKEKDEVALIMHYCVHGLEGSNFETFDPLIDMCKERIKTEKEKEREKEKQKLKKETDELFMHMDDIRTYPEYRKRRASFSQEPTKIDNPPHGRGRSHSNPF